MAEKAKCEDVVTLNNEIYIRKNSSVFPKESKTANVKSIQKHPYVIGKQFLVITPTLWFVGTVKSVTETYLILDDAAWIADTGRFNEFLKDGTFKECEPCNGPAIINHGGIIASVPTPTISITVK